MVLEERVGAKKGVLMKAMVCCLLGARVGMRRKERRREGKSGGFMYEVCVAVKGMDINIWKDRGR